MTTFFVLCDSGERHFPELLNTPFVGPFIKGGVAATVGWWYVFVPVLTFVCRTINLRISTNWEIVMQAHLAL
jgi:hypothetical protein